MMKPNVLIVTYYWPPSGGAGVQRFLKFAKYLPEQGYRPVVLTVENPTYPITDPSLADDVPDSVKVYRSRTWEVFGLYAALTGREKNEITKPTIELQSGGPLSRLGAWIRANLLLPDARAGWLLTARPRAVELIRRFNIPNIITTGPPHSVHFVGRHVKKKTGARWIADFRDPWSEVYYNQLLPRTALARMIDRRLERRVLKAADEVVVISPSMADSQKRVADRRYHVIPNGFDPDDYPGAEAGSSTSPESSAGDESGPSGRLTVRFIGSVREAAIPEGFLQAVAVLPEELKGKLEVEFIGNAHPELRQIVDRLELAETVTLSGYRPHKQAVAAMAEADLLLLSVSRTPGSEQILTGKLFEYLGAGNPILFLGPVKGDAAKIISENDQGVAFEHDEFREIGRFLRSVLENPSSLKPYSRGKDTDMRKHPYSRQTLTRRLAELLEGK